MGTNACWIQVELRGTTRDRVIATIGEHYVSQGATRGPAAWRKLDGLGSLARTRSLGIAISAGELGWVTLCDSERYTADYALARHIAGALATRVRVIGIWDVSQLELDQYLGPGDSVCENRTPSAYYDKHEPDEREGVVVPVVRRPRAELLRRCRQDRHA